MHNLAIRQRRARLSKALAALSFAAVAGFAAPVALAQTESARIGFVNTDKLLREANPAKAAQQKIERDFARRDKEIQDLGARLKSLTDKLDKDASVLSDAERTRRQREIGELDKDFQRRQREFREDLNQRRNEELSSVLERANSTIKQIAEQERYDLILQEAVYISPRLDITDKVIRALNAASGSAGSAAGSSSGGASSGGSR